MNAKTVQRRRRAVTTLALVLLVTLITVFTPETLQADSRSSIQQQQAAAIKAAQERAAQARQAQQAAIRAAQQRAQQAQQQAIARQQQLREQAQRNAAAAQAAQQRAIQEAQARQRQMQEQAQRNIAAAQAAQRRAAEEAQQRQRQLQQEAQQRALAAQQAQQRARDEALARQRQLQEQAQRSIAATQAAQRRAVAEAQERQRQAQEELQQRRQLLQQQAQQNLATAREAQQRNLQQAQQTAAANLATAAEAQRQIRESVRLRQERLQGRGIQVVQATQAAGQVARDTAWNPRNNRAMDRQHQSVQNYHQTLDEQREQTSLMVDRAEHRLSNRQDERTQVLLNHSQTDWSQYTPAEAVTVRAQQARELYQTNLDVTLAGQELAQAHGLNQHAQAWKLSAVKQEVSREVNQAQRIYQARIPAPRREHNDHVDHADHHDGPDHRDGRDRLPFWKRHRRNDVEVNHHLTIVNNEVHVINPVCDYYYPTPSYYDDFNDCSSITYGHLPVDNYLDYGTGHLDNLPAGIYGSSYTTEACGVSPYGRTSAFGVSAFGRPSCADYRFPGGSCGGNLIHYQNRIKWIKWWDGCFRHAVSPFTYHRTKYYWHRFRNHVWTPYWYGYCQPYYYRTYYWYPCRYKPLVQPRPLTGVPRRSAPPWAPPGTRCAPLKKENHHENSASKKR